MLHIFSSTPFLEDRPVVHQTEKRAMTRGSGGLRQKTDNEAPDSMTHVNI